MPSHFIEHKRQTATLEDVKKHLQSCDDTFFPPLSQRVTIDEYSKKIVAHAILFEGWHDSTLIGLVAAYFSSSTAYITNTSVLPEFRNNGLAYTLVSHCITHAKVHGLKEIALEVNVMALPAQKLYAKLLFTTHNQSHDQVLYMTRSLITPATCP